MLVRTRSLSLSRGTWGLHFETYLDEEGDTSWFGLLCSESLRLLAGVVHDIATGFYLSQMKVSLRAREEAEECLVESPDTSIVFKQFGKPRLEEAVAERPWIE